MRLLNVLNETNVRLNEKMATLPRLSVSQGKGVVPSDSLNVNSMQASNYEKYKIVQPGHLVVNRFNAYKGALGRAPFRGIVSPDYFTGEINRSRSDDRYIEYFLRVKPTANLIERDMSGMGSGDPNSSAFSRFDVRSFLNLTIPVTDLQRQQRIADYLDRETAEIDTAVADLDHYAELLEKRRTTLVQQIISEQNGVRRVKLAHLARFGNGQDWKKVAADDGEFPVYGSGGQFGWASDFLHDGEAVLFGRKGTVDRPIYVEGKFWTVDTMYYAVPDTSRCIGKYLYYWATTIPFKTIATNTALPSVTSMDLSQLYVPIPSKKVQHDIATYLDQETAEITSLINESRKLRDLLLKRRSVLITEVVTGRKRV